MEKDINIRYSKIVKQYERNKYISMENYIKTTLQIKDKNIKILEKCEEEYIKNVKTLVYYGNLTYTPHHCINCGCKNKNNTIVKNGYRIASTLILPSISSLPAILRLKKQRFLCRECNSTFVAETNLVNKKCRITNRIKQVILCDLTETLSLNAIARRNNVSVNTVVKISNIGNKGVVNYNYLPGFTQAIEAFNRQLRKVTKTKSIFPNDQALYKMLYLTMVDASRKWTTRIKEWDRILSQLRIYFEGRL